MPYESTIVVSIPDQGSYQDIKEHISATTSLHGLEPDRWSICVTSETNSSWGFIYYTHPSPAVLDRMNFSWNQRFPECAIERVHRITQPKFFEDMVNKTQSGMIGIGMVQHLIDLSSKGVTTAGMIDWMQDVRRDSLMILGTLQKVREAPYEPGKNTEAYP
jgi:hypothetical protein